MQTLSKRMMSVVHEKTTEYRRFKQLEDATGIPADNWKNWLYGRQRPTAEMIEAVGRTWPEYSFWIISGISDPKHGHVAPDKEGFPTPGKRKENTVTLFKALIEMKSAAEHACSIYLQEDQLQDFEASDFLIRNASKLVAKKDPQIQAKLVSLWDACDHAAKLRKAEAMVDNEVLGLLYEKIDDVLDATESLIADVPESSKSELQQIIAQERSSQLIRKSVKTKK
jgi:hypothetical protein